MSPSELTDNAALEEEFKRLASQCLTFVDDWSHAIITPEVQRMYARCKPAVDASNDYVCSCRAQFESDGTVNTMCHSRDEQKRVGSQAEFVRAQSQVLIGTMNTKLREPPVLLFWAGALFEATVNKEGSFNYSQLLLMLDVPTEER